MINNLDTEEWFNMNINKYDYVIIDAPWNYVRCQASSFWDKVCYMDIFQNCTTNYMFIWTTVEGMSTLMSQQIESEYELKALIPWLCTNSDVNTETSYKICREFLAVFCKPRCSFIKLCSPTIILEPNITTKPRKWEEQLIRTLSEKGLEGRYISPQGFITFKLEKQAHIHRKDLF